MTQGFSYNRLVTAKYALNPSLRVPGMQQGQDLKKKIILYIKTFRARFGEEQTLSFQELRTFCL